MNKALHVLVYVLLVVAGMALFYEKSLYDKKELLKDRNRTLEDYVVKVARTIEMEDAPKPATSPEAKKDISPVEAKEVDTPDEENVLEDYPVVLEQANLPTFSWDTTEMRMQLRQLYFLDANGMTVPDAANDNKPVTTGKGTMRELLDQLFSRAANQQAKLNTTRSELQKLREKLEALTQAHNALKPPARKDKILIEELKAKIEKLETEKAELEEQIKKLKQQIEDLNAEVTSLKDEVTAARDETEAAKEDLAKSQKLVEQLKHLLQQRHHDNSRGGGALQFTAGDKGKIVDVDNEKMFAVIEFTDEALKEILGPERQSALPRLEMGIRRKGYNGPSGEFVGRLKLRQAVAGKNFVIADVLGDWRQVELQAGDLVYAD